ncbi:hypothetical protein [Arthrobacter sp. ISL-65]|uniref:hypothetical protein n=1 Tax=Arthrobacter sp. ISL-65 TaxID=2819112 RepID=UPI001BE94E2B|nr:hypothetical protein [Arthrobacter sp. ISL-65]MBT2551388.1 hypothetical protein [Arthrobacter sp. ISL-65]
MTITSPTRQRRPLAARLALASTVSLGLLGGPLAFAGAASAAPSHDYGKHDNCSVTAYTPKKADYGKKDRDYGKSVKVEFKFKIHCDKRTMVYFDHKMFQGHGKRADVLKHDHGWVWVHGDKYFNDKAKVHADRGDKDVKVSHTVKIQFKDKDRNNHWTWKTDSDHAYARIDLDRGRGY